MLSSTGGPHDQEWASSSWHSLYWSWTPLPESVFQQLHWWTHRALDRHGEPQPLVGQTTVFQMHHIAKCFLRVKTTQSPTQCLGAVPGGSAVLLHRRMPANRLPPANPGFQYHPTGPRTWDWQFARREEEAGSKDDDIVPLLKLEQESPTNQNRNGLDSVTITD